MNRSWLPYQAPSDPELKQQTTHPTATTSPTGTTAARTRNRKSHAQSGTAAQVSTVSISFRTIHEHGTLLTKYLEARKHIFLDDLGWHVSEADGMEFDQYDTPQARWVILHQFGEVIAGVRMLPTTAACGIYSYMLRDAQLGLLADIPTDILFFEAPVEHNVWEASRFFIVDSVPAAHRAAVQRQLFKGMSDVAAENGALHVLGIVPAIWARWARRLGVEATPIGARFSIDGFYSQSVLFKVDEIPF